MGFDSYNMSSAISQGNMLNDSVRQLNLQTALTNKARVDEDKKEAKGQEGRDKESGIFGGIKDGLAETTAMGNFKTAMDTYRNSIKPTSIGAGGFSEVKPTLSDLQDKAKQMGENTQRDYSAEGIAEESGDSDLTKLAKGGAIGEELETTGSKVVGALGKGVGIAGGLASSGLDIASDIESFKAGKGAIAGDNLAEKIANIGTIGGTALDMIGLIPGLQIAGVLGAGLQAVSGVVGAVGQAEETSDAIKRDKQEEQTGAGATQDHTIVAQQTLAGSFAGGRSQA
jgi:hypothetical protein